MPYIMPALRKHLEPTTAVDAANPGELNFQITMLCKQYLETHGESYNTHNAIMGVLTCAPLEWYRRRTAPYEDKKIEENGDV